MVRITTGVTAGLSYKEKQGFRNNTVFCDACQTKNCRHIEYALNLPKVYKILTEKGWIIKQGKIIRGPF